MGQLDPNRTPIDCFLFLTQNDEMILENMPKASDDSRTQKRRNYPRRALSPCTGHSLITLDNVHVRPQWRITLAWLTHPSACACIPPTHSTHPSIISEPRTSKKDSRTKKEHAPPPPVRRAGRRSIRCVEAARFSAAYFWMMMRTRLRLHRGTKGGSTRSMSSSISSRPLSPDPFGR